MLGEGLFFKKSSPKCSLNVARDDHKAFLAPAIGGLEEWFKHTRTSSLRLLQAPDCGSGECLPYGCRAVAFRTISLLISSKNCPPPRTYQNWILCNLFLSTRIIGSIVWVVTYQPTKLEIGQNWRFWCKTSHLGVLLVHDPFQHLASAGEITKQEKWVYEDPALRLLTFHNFTHGTKLPQSLLPMFHFVVVE